MSNIWFTSDTHFGHHNVIKYTNRPFTSKEEMDKGLINNHNSVVKKDDTVYHLGDFSLSKKVDYIKSIFSQLNGRLRIIRGNHDDWARMAHKFDPDAGDVPNIEWVKDYYQFSHNGKYFVLCHYPMATWNHAHHGAIHLHGHCHGSYDYMNTDKVKRLDVGVDSSQIPQKYFPTHINDIIAIMDKRSFSAVDHHGM